MVSIQDWLVETRNYWLNANDLIDGDSVTSQIMCMDDKNRTRFRQERFDLAGKYLI